MTKNLLILSLFFLSVLKVNAQCIPDTSITKPGFYPKALPDGDKGVDYSQIIQFKVIKDTTVIIGGNPTVATIDSAYIMEVNGMPNGLDFKLNKANPMYTPEEVGCALISGKPTKVDTFRLEVRILFYAKIFNISTVQEQTLNAYVIVINGPAGINKISHQPNLVYPNPLTADKLMLNNEKVLPGTIVSIYNCHGQLLASQITDSNQSLLFNYPKGIYYLSLINGDKVSRVRLVKE